jgi:hypothetical protein
MTVPGDLCRGPKQGAGGKQLWGPMKGSNRKGGALGPGLISEFKLQLGTVPYHRPFVTDNTLIHLRILPR